MRVEVQVRRELSVQDLTRLAPEFDLVFMHSGQLQQRIFFWSSPLAKALLDQAQVCVMAFIPSPSAPRLTALVASRHESAIAPLVSGLARLGDCESIELLHVIDRAHLTELDEAGLSKDVFQHSLRLHWIEVCRRFEDAVATVSLALEIRISLILAHGDTRSEILKRLQQSSTAMLVLGWQR